MGNKIKLIIFDAYGVFLKGGYPLTAKAIVDKYGGDEDKVYEVMYKKYFNQAAVKEITQDEAWQEAIDELNLPIDIKEIKKIHYSFMGVNQKVVELAKKLKNDYKILLLSKNTGPQFKDALDLFPEIKEVFEKNIINTWEYDLPKASKKTIELVLNKFGVKPEEVVYIDDQKENLVEAEKMGVKVIFYQEFDQVKNELEEALEV